VKLRHSVQEVIGTEYIAAMMRKAMRMALEGNLAAMRFVMDRVVGRAGEEVREPEMLAIDLPPMRAAADCNLALERIIAAIGSGALLGGDSGSAVPGNMVLALVLAASALLLVVCCWIPPGAAAAGRARWAALGRFAADRRFWLFVASGAALQSSHQLYYGFGTLYWRELGFADPVIGVLWAEGVVAEIVLFWYSARLVARLGPLGLMALGGIAGVLRWSLMGIVPALAAAAVLQLLHALTFGASHLGAMYFMARSVPPGAAASAQSLYAAVSAGLGSGLVMLVAGALYGAYGGQAYLFMAVLSAAGLGGVVALARRR